MRSLVSSETLFPCRNDLPVAMFTERALAKRCVPNPANPIILKILIQTVNCNSSPDNVSGLRREVAAAFRRCSASREQNVVAAAGVNAVRHARVRRNSETFQTPPEPLIAATGLEQRVIYG